MAASVFMMVFCVLKLGRHIRKIPQTVVTGFSCGIGAMMFLSQLPVMMGVKAHLDRTSNNLLYQSWQVLMQATHVQLAALLISVAVIVVAILSARFLPKAPAPLLGVLVASSIAAMFGLHQKELGRLALEIPPFAGFAWRATDVWNVLPDAFGLAFVASVNILITSRVVEHFRGRHPHLRRGDADAELGAYGIANLIAGMFAAPMSVGIPARSLASVRSGGTTRMSNLFHAGFILAFISLGASFIAKVPIPALAGVTAYIGICLLEWGTWRRLPRMNRLDAAAFLSTAVAVLAVNAILAVAIGCSFYAVRYGHEMLRRWSAKDELRKMAVGAR
jgi:SulP family sulfate permease